MFGFSWHRSSPQDRCSATSLIATPVTLADPITIRVGRRGVVGLHGRMITIGVDGAWSLSTFTNGSTTPTSTSGRLSPREMQLIAGIMGERHGDYTLSSLPAEIGSSHINCPVASISSGHLHRIAHIEINSPRTPNDPAARAFSEAVSKILTVMGFS